MAFVRLLLLAVGLLNLRGCFTPLCDAVRRYETKVIATRTGDQLLRDAARTAGGDLLLDMGIGYLPPEYHHTVVRANDVYGPQELAKFKLTDHYGSGVVAAGESWWYSIAGRRDGKSESGVFFATPEVTFVAVDEIHSAEWLPLDDEEPRGLLVGHDRDGLRAVEVTREGVRRQWPLPMQIAVASVWRSAERLDGGAIALVYFDHAESRIVLEMLDGDEPVRTVLRGNPSWSHVRLTTALSADGMLAVVLESKSGELEAAVFDPRNPGELKWQRLTAKDESGRYPRVIFHDGKFIAAWLASTKELRARTFTAEGTGPAGTIAPLVQRGTRDPAITIIPDGEELLFLWQADEVMVRRVPEDFAGLWFVEQLCQLFGGTSVAAR